jgi:hypothetical protein
VRVGEVGLRHRDGAFVVPLHLRRILEVGVDGAGVDGRRGSDHEQIMHDGGDMGLRPFVVLVLDRDGDARERDQKGADERYVRHLVTVVL